MAAIVYQTSKQTGITYAYESLSYWDKEKRQSRARRKCIGRVDPETKEIIPTRKRVVASDSCKKDKVHKRGPVPIENVSRSFYGATYLFDAIGEKLGITADLKKCFPDTYKQILSTAYYLIMEDKNPLSRFPKWAATHTHPYGKNIPSQRSSELFAFISEDDKHRFFRLQGKRRIEKEYWAYDTTSISSYSRCLRQVRYGMNKDHEPLAQINLALLFGEESNLPFYYRKLAGNIPDVKTVKNLLADIDFLGYDKIKLVMDRGFYSEANINDLYHNHLKFLIAAKKSLTFVKAELDNVRDSIRTWANYNQKHDLYACTTEIDWGYSQERPYKGDMLKGKRRMYMHLYFNSERALEDAKNFNALLCRLQEELESGATLPEHDRLYAKYFDATTTPVRGTKVIAREDAIAEARKNYGFFVLLSNEVREPIAALEIYRNKDLVEKAFGNLKERLSFNRMAVSSDQSLDGKLFVEFIALIFLSYLKKKMQDGNLFKKYTMHELLDEMDIIECFEYPGYERRVGEVTKKQIELYEAMGIVPPSSLH
ncbi:MAG: IS1634 family transposase [Deltaproteobacteria bacterium]|jgi:transposase|nr:IS1634 family transposase [Deltaproteobacteria bacterium]